MNRRFTFALILLAPASAWAGGFMGGSSSGDASILTSSNSWTYSQTIGSNTMTSGNPLFNFYGYNVTDSTATGGYLQSRYHGATGNNITLGAYDNATQAPNLRIQVDDNGGAHIGFNVGGTAASAVTIEKMATFDADLDGNLNIRGFAGMSGSDPNEEFRFWMNTAGGTIDTQKGAIFMTPATGRLYVQASTLTVSGGNIVISTAGAGITFPDGTRQRTAGGSFTWPISVRSPKLPGVSPCVVSNSTTAFTASLLCDASSNENVSDARTLKPYGGGSLSVDIQYSMVSATSGNVVLVSSVACISDGDSQDVDTKTYAAGSSVTSAVPGTAGHKKTATITGLNDSCAVGDLLALYIERQGASASDTATGDIEIRDIYAYE